MEIPDRDGAFIVFDNHDSGCLSYGVEIAEKRWFIKRAIEPGCEESLTRAASLHRRIGHPSILGPSQIHESDGATTGLVYPWIDGIVLNHSTKNGSDRSGLDRFHQLPAREIAVAVEAILDAHVSIADAGSIAVDLYDGCFLYDFSAKSMKLIDLDEYRPGPIIVEGDRLPGPRRYMAPEEFERGATVDQRTTVFNQGQVIYHLFFGAFGVEPGGVQRAVVAGATHLDPTDRYQTVRSFIDSWSRSN